MNRKRLKELLQDLNSAHLIVFGDFFLDLYLLLDRKISETSIETGIEAYQVTGTRKYPGAAGTVVSNLRALKVNVTAVGLTGDDGNGYDLRRRLQNNGVDLRGLIEVPGYDTPTYLKPMMKEFDGYVHELNRMDTKHRVPLTVEMENALISKIRELLPEADGMLVVDQVSERNCGVVTDRIRKELKSLSEANPDKVISVDSRDYLGLFESVMLKANVSEAMRAVNMTISDSESQIESAQRSGRALQARTGRPVVITLGSDGLYVIENAADPGSYLPSVKTTGPVDIVGAGDSVNASIGAALCSGASLKEAGMLGNLVASIVIQQIGVTGTASPEQVLAQFDAHPEVPYFER